MRNSVRDAFIPFTQRFEGYTLFMYLDVKNLLTIGYGNLIDPVPPAILDFRDAHGAPATPQRVQAEANYVKSLTRLSEMGGGIYRWYTTLRATEASINQLALAMLASNETTLKQTFAEWDTWPASAQLATLSIAWACGSHFTLTWPKFTAACRAQDWAAAALESHIEDSHNPGVVPRNKANLELLQAAATGGDPETLPNVI